MKKHVPEKRIRKTNPEDENRAENLRHKRDNDLDRESTTLYLCDGKRTECEKTYCSFLDNGACRHTTDIKHAKNKGKRHYTTREDHDGTVFIEIENDD